MDQDRRFDPDEKRSDPPSEGVRIIGAEEAAEAIERGDVAPRRGEDQPRYGDRPRSDVGDGPRPVLRFPLGSSSDPRDIERPAVAEPEPPAWAADEPAGAGREPEPEASEPISEPVELPHWTEPPTGQVPQILPDRDDDPDADFEDWASFAASSPRWRDDVSGHEESDFGDWGADADEEARIGALDTSERPSHDEYFSFADLDAGVTPGASVFAPGDDDYEPEPFEPDWDPALQEPAYEEAAVAAGAPRRAERSRRAAPQRSSRPPARSGGGDRDMGAAVGVGVGFLALALVLFNLGTVPAMVLVTAVIGVAVAELYGALRQAGYQPVALAGIVGSVGLVIGAYNYGYGAYPAVLFLTTAVCLLWYLVGAAHESPVLNVGATLLGVLWVGLFGSFAALMLGLGDPGLGILLAAIIGTIGYDVGGLFIGRNAGRQPLSAASPNKTVEGLLGGCAVAFVVVVVLSALVGFGPIDSFAEGALVGLAVALFAPLGDLCESLVKRDLEVKDMGSILPGHGGLMDRFDGMLFVLPAVWLLATLRDFFM
ncbi:MAG TPA: phosphatidate cytidylyltransferase [Acidimicrobiales bacterium]|nr:phosphatidate cytidylyltransferase [Acidimicrobiales bacterium]